MRPARPRPLRDLALALGFLTLLPVTAEWPEHGAPDAVGYYAWVGWLLAGEAVLLEWGLSYVGRSAVTAWLLGGALVVSAWAVTTRFLHWDGLADSADALFGSHDRKRRLEIMRDSRIGSFGALALVLSTALRLAAVAALAPGAAAGALIASGALGRAAMLLPLLLLRPARPDGLGTSLARVQGGTAVVGLALGAAVALLVLPERFAVGAVLLAALAGLGAARLAGRLLGGYTGDVFGATSVVAECLVLSLLSMRSG